MTLFKFKQRLKIASFATIAIFYGLSLYSLGKHSSESDLLRVKGASTVNNQNDSLDKPLPYADVQSAKIISQSVKLCSNSTYSYQLTYPNNWFTTYNKDDQKCKYFAPYSFIVPEFVEKQFMPIQLDALTLEDWAPTVNFYENPNEYQNVVSTKNTQINDRLVKKIETVSTGEGSTPRGYNQVVYLIFDTRTPLLIVYQQTDANDDVNNVRLILEDMASSVKYF